jgi:hypothetical protein
VGLTSSIAAATLQESIKQIIKNGGGTISSERVGKPEDFGMFKLINVSIQFVLPDVSTLSDIIYSIETHTPFFVVKELETRVRNFVKPGELMIKLDVSAITEAK